MQNTKKMPKYEKGILGYRKDPKKQMLFSFSATHGDEWPSSDSEDSDFEPSTEKKDSDDSDLEPFTENKRTLVKTGEASRKSRAKGSQGMKSKFGVKGKNKATSDNVLKTVEKSSQKRSPKGDFGSELEAPDRAIKKGKIDGSYDICLNDETWSICDKVPPELWLRIFRYVTDSNGPLPFLCRAAKVCHMWHKLSSHHSLWNKVDLSYGWLVLDEAIVKWLCETRLSHCTSLNLTALKTASAVQIFAKNCPNLRSVNLSRCQKLKSEGVRALAECCPHLADVDLSFTSVDAVSVACLKHLIEHCGERLTHFNVGGNKLTGFATVLKCIMENCPNLQLLDLTDVKFSSDFIMLNIERMQSCCPKLRVLQMANCKFQASAASSAVLNSLHGFSELEQLSLARISSLSGSNASTRHSLNRILKASCRLKLLDLRGCDDITAQMLCDLPVDNLEQLFLSRSSIGKCEDMEDVFRKWRHSLLELDLSWITFPEHVLDGLAVLTEGITACPLQDLNLAGTSVGTAVLKILLKGCPKLCNIDLTSCRSLPRGIKREYKGEDLKKLKSCL